MVVDLYGFFVIKNLTDGHKLADCLEVIQKHTVEKGQEVSNRVTLSTSSTSSSTP